MNTQAQDDFDKLVLRRVKIYKQSIKLNRDGWNEIHRKEKKLGWFSLFSRFHIPPPLPPPLPRDIELRAIEMGIIKYQS